MTNDAGSSPVPEASAPSETQLPESQQDPTAKQEQSKARKVLMLALKLLAALLIIAAPALVAAQFVPGLASVAFFGVLGAAFGWISGGPKIGAAVVVSLTALGIISILLRDHTWALALILILLGLGYGYAASKGIGKAVLQLPILTPYFMHEPPALFSDPPVIDTKYLIGVAVIMLVTGLWAVLVLRLAAGERHLTPQKMLHPRAALLYGGILGLVSAIVMIIGTTTDLKTHWIWCTLTLYVLADPQQLFTAKKMGGRVIGTLLGFAVVALLAFVGLPDGVLSIIALLALWLCLVLMVIKKPYWEYTLVLTIAVVLMDSSEVDTILLTAERFGFTLVGAGLAILVALLVNMIAYSRFGLATPEAKGA